MQSAFKSSWFTEGEQDRVLRAVHDVLHDRGLEASVVFSGGRFLDLIPPRSGKGSAARYLADRFGMNPADVVTAGDSGNDLDMMRSDLGFRAIVVGNAQPEVRALTGPHVYAATHPFAAGIAEGLRHFGWLDSD